MEGEVTSTMLEAVGTGVTQVISWVGEVVTALTGASGALSGLLPVFGVGIGISVVLFGVKAIKSIVWGA